MTFNTVAKSYSGAVDSYEAGRPSYPAALVAALPLAGARRVVELGAGTGKFTRLMLPHLSGIGRIVAVEPVADMAARLAGEPKVQVVNSPASDTGLATGSADLVVCAQSFHWFDDEASVAEIARLLHPGATLALIWNMRDNRVGWVGELSRLIDVHAGDTPRHQTKRWEWILRDPRFRFDRELVEAYPHAMSRDGVHARALSTSFIARLSSAEKQALRASIDAVLDAHGLQGAAGITMPYVSHLYLLTRQ